MAVKDLPFPLSAWAIVDEAYSVLYSNENWRMYNGLKFDEEYNPPPVGANLPTTGSGLNFA